MKKSILTKLILSSLIFASAACSHRQQSESKQTEADSLIDAAMFARNYEHVLTLCDSLEQRGDISLFKAASKRGWAYYYLGQPKLTEKELRRVLDATPTNTEDSLQYFNTVVQFANSRSIAGDYNEALEVTLPALESLQKMDRENSSENVVQLLFDLTTRVGIIQMNLGMKEEADKTFEESYNYEQRKPLNTPADYWRRFWNINRYIASYFNANDMSSAEKWLIRQDSVTTLIRERCGFTPVDSEEVMAISYLNHAAVAAVLNRQEDFNRAVAAYRTTQAANTAIGKVNLASAFLEAKHYAEAADGYAAMDQHFAELGKTFSLDNLGWYGDKFKANYKAGRRDTALAVAALVFENLDSAITEQKKSDAAELATVYETQKKDAEIAQQQISLTRQRWFGTLAALALLTAFFIIYTLYRRRAQKRLAAAHEKLEVAHTELKTAYDKLEETTAAKERIESELRIARDIQMSMVPSVFPPFPERKDIDLFASMTPAKEVGGDLYDFFLNDVCLYFALGDVSGKGVPASLFMTQATRLFRTLASEGLKPEQLATRMNSGLCEGNDTMMFVTMFIGVVHLDTGQLEFCNCGHNPPMLDDRFLQFKHKNRPLGLFDNLPFQGESIPDIRGKKLLIYTDGLNEAMNPAHDQFGNERIIDIMSKSQDKTACQVIEILKAAVEQHRSGAEPNDDLTMLCIRITPELFE